MNVDILTQDTIEKYIIPHVSKGKRGAKPKVPLWMIVRAILRHLKMGFQWQHMPMLEYFPGLSYSWRSVYHHWRRWCADGSWQRVWQAILRAYKHFVDLSNANVDGSHTRVVKGGEKVGYQGRKKARTTNLLTLSDSRGLPIAISESESGEHNDTYDISAVMNTLFDWLRGAGIAVEGLFLNADAGFDTEQMRTVCAESEVILNAPVNKRNGKGEERDEYMDDELYKKRGAIERTFAWMDSYRALIVRYDVLESHWRANNILVCIILLINRILTTNR